MYFLTGALSGNVQTEVILAGAYNRCTPLYSSSHSLPSMDHFFLIRCTSNKITVFAKTRLRALSYGLDTLRIDFNGEMKVGKIYAVVGEMCGVHLPAQMLRKTSISDPHERTLRGPSYSVLLSVAWYPQKKAPGGTLTGTGTELPRSHRKQ